MKIKKICFSTQLSELYGRDNYQSHIEVGKEYWYFFGEDSNIFRETKQHWNKLKVTYMRSGCLFYVFPDYPSIKEEFCPVSCFMASQFILAELDPLKDLSDLITDIDTEVAKIVYCFNDEHTVVKNWPNEKTLEADDNELFEKFGKTTDWLLIKTLEQEEN